MPARESARRASSATVRVREPQPRMDVAGSERAVERRERGRHVDGSAPCVRETHALELREQPQQSARGALGHVPVVGDGARVRPPGEHRPGRAAPDRDAVVVGGTQVVEELAPVGDPDVRRPPDLAAQVRNRLGHHDVVHDHAEAPPEPRPARGPRAHGQDDLVGAHRAVLRPDDRRPAPLRIGHLRAFEDPHAVLEGHAPQAAGEPRGLADRAVRYEGTALEAGRVGVRAALIARERADPMPLAEPLPEAGAPSSPIPACHVPARTPSTPSRCHQASTSCSASHRSVAATSSDTAVR